MTIRHPPPAGRRAGARQPAVSVSRAIDEVAPAHRDVLVELFYRGVSLDEVARAGGTSITAVKTRLAAAGDAPRSALDRQIAARKYPLLSQAAGAARPARRR